MTTSASVVPVEPTPPARRAEAVNLRTAELILASVPPNTDRSYRQAWATFDTWCTDQGRVPLPTSAAVLADYVTHLVDLGRAPATIKHAMGVIGAYNVAAGLPQLGKHVTAQANAVLRGHKRARGKDGQRTKEAPPITRPRLRQMCAACDKTTLAGKRDRLLLVLGFALAGRRSELAALQIEDVTIGEDDLDILIRASKTDQDADGEVVNVPAGDHVDTDPVGLLREYLDALDVHGIDTTRGPLLRAITKQDRPYRHGSLSADAVHDIVRRCAQRAGLPKASSYSGHSLRSGFATQAAEDRVPQGVWTAHGRWSPTSPVPNKYVRRADRKHDNPLRRMGL